ncbi:Uncharacterized protein AC496_4116 [Pseudomonas savastanoi pv. glycinea]|uniref:Uncharacterized protein n=1 Tax=Pseudomonas savastanoi pv. glycinea TaxID=318 RepID=A0ABR5L933_PSESG|nr:Uncharacterized protein AC498_1458 [Pseudomonas savastanoi pv. glycinea]KPC32259.1 Uncharacterized protein AC497_0100 [Pseudomonas savastanoi pv. glycinea]KPC41809.1 Uncharacterized protein AC496_4116 [Pseudomonas savastanoi pv. glycinea]
MKVLAVAGPVLDHARLAVENFPAVFATEPQRIGVAGHQAVGVAEVAHRVAIAVVHTVQLAVAVVAIAHQCFNGFVVDDALDGTQAAGHFVVVQVYTLPASGADVGQNAVFAAHEMQKMAECVFDAFQRHRLVVVGHFAEVIEHVVQGLQQVMTAFGTHQIQLFLCVVDALVVVQCHERHAAALVVTEVQKAAFTAQALFPGQDPAIAQCAVDSQVAGIEACPFDGHQTGQAEVGLIDQQLAPSGGVDRVAVQATQHFFGHGGDAEAKNGVPEKDTAHKLQRARACRFQTGLHAQLGNAEHGLGAAGHDQQNIHGVTGHRRDFVVHRQVALGTAADEDVGRAGAYLRAAGQLVALARSGLAVDEDVAGAFGHLDDRRVLVAHGGALDSKSSRPAVDEDVGRGRLDLPRGRAEGAADTLPDTGDGITGQVDCHGQ